MTLIMLAFAAVLVTAIALRAYWGDGRTHLRRCPKCWYDMSQTLDLRCSECGNTVVHEAQLFQRRANKLMYRSWAEVVAVSATIGVFVVIPKPWTTKVPRPLLRALLAVAAPAPAMPAAGAGLPVPTATLRQSTSAWERVVWQHQVTVCFEAWSAIVHATQGPVSDAELAQLVPIAIEVSNLHASRDSSLWEDFQLVSNPNVGFLARRNAATDADAQLRANWVLSELQTTGLEVWNRPDYVPTPDSLLMQALAHSDASVRLYGLTRFARVAHQHNISGQVSPMPAGTQLIEAMVENDPDPAVRQKARGVLQELRDFRPVFRLPETPPYKGKGPGK